MNQRSNLREQVNIQAKSLDLAIMQAASAFETTSDRIEYKILSQSQAKLFGLLGGAKVEIVAWKKQSGSDRNHSRSGRESSHRQGGSSQGSHRPNGNNGSGRGRSHNGEDQDAEKIDLSPLSPEETKNLIEELKEFCAGVCSFLVDGTIDIDAWQEEDRLVVNIKNKDISDQLNKNIKLAESLEHLLRKKPRHLKRELPFKIFIDADGIRKQRESELRSMAQDLSEQVHQNKKAVVLNYKSAYDRKIIHMALDKDDRVFTKSIGSGPNRKLMILPAREGNPGSESHQHSSSGY